MGQAAKSAVLLPFTFVLFRHGSQHFAGAEPDEDDVRLYVGIGWEF